MKKLPILVIATRNQAKVRYYQVALASIAEQVTGLNDLGVSGKPEETGTTAGENARIKARFYAALTGLPVFCEDEALYADFLKPEQQPGVYVRRIDGVIESSDEGLLAHWERLLRDVEPGRRTGYWHIAYCLATPGGYVAVTEHDHPIKFYTLEPNRKRISGWPLSSIEGSVKLDHPHSERTSEELAAAQEETKALLENAMRELLAAM